MTRTPRQHGERRCYLQGCRRPECVEANKRYCKQYRVQTIRQPLRVDATPVRQRLQQWVDQGYTQTQIGAAVGKSSGDISKLLNGQPTVAPRIATQILQSPGPTGLPAHARVDSTGTIRRGRALHAIGYPIYLVAAQVPMATNHLGRLLDHEPPTVSAAVAQGMAVIYRQWSGRPGPSHFAVFSARRRNWHGPLAWDDIDNPNEQPEISEPYRPIPKGGRDDLRRQEIRHLLGCGESVASIAKQMNANEKYIGDLIGRGLGDDYRRAA
ncbi:hypothetical protein [Streptomyces sp. NPDC126499]|uniref:hypothetical protein n=1 Tax=Streptomyces sp. NPDC126499 TaxID=3155314 RepID=UPI00331D5A87